MNYYVEFSYEVVSFQYNMNDERRDYIQAAL